MNILQLSTSDQRGAYEAAVRLHKAFLAAGHASLLVVRYKTVLDNTIIQSPSSVPVPIQKAYDNCLKLIHKNPKYYFFNTIELVSFFSADTILSLLPYQPDIIICHWISKFINMKVIYDMQKKTGAKVIWHFLDMAPMTGGCHYAWQCKRYQKKCGMCPAIYSHRAIDLSSINILIKNHFLEKIKPIIITPTRELFDQCKKSSLFKNRQIHKILLPIDLNIFTPGKKIQLRRKFGIPTTSKVISIRSDMPQQKRKGFDYILKSLTIFKKIHIGKIHIVIIGKISDSDRKKIPFTNTVFSSLIGNHDLADVYRLSDVLLSASIQDSGPMMINEAISSGLPVVSFPIGVSKDLIFNSKTGYISRMKSSSDLADKLRVLFSLKKPAYQKMSQNCRRLACQHLNYLHVVKQYEKCF